MDYEKKYNEALKVIEGLYNVVKYQSSSDALLTSQTIEEAFPELTESEDEKIRKTIIDFLKNIEEENGSSLIFGNTTTTDMIAWLEKQGEQKPNYCHHEIDLSGCSEEYRKAYYDGWNNCNMQHAQLEAEQNPAWSEEDEYQINTILHRLDLKKELYKKEGNKAEEKRYSTQYNWLKSLKDRVQHQPKQDWSEEDSKRLARIHQFIWANRKGDTDEIYQLEQDADWLMTLKPNNWKPSEEQMLALETAIRCRTMPWEQLGTLYNDLKKL